MGKAERKSGFTLTELMVVVAIVALVVAILVPSLRRAKDSAREAVCLTHLRQIGVASVTYAANNSQYIPRGNRCIWFKAFLPYLSMGEKTTDYRVVSIYRCPSFPDPVQRVCYVDSSWTFRDQSDTSGWEIMDPTPILYFDRPSETVYLADNEDGWWRPIITDEACHDRDRLDVWNPSHLPTSDREEITYGRRVSRDRHRTGCNVLYVDGHAGWVDASQMTVDMWRDQWW